MNATGRRVPLREQSMKYFRSTYRESINRRGKRDTVQDSMIKASTVERSTKGSLEFSLGE